MQKRLKNLEKQKHKQQILRKQQEEQDKIDEAEKLAKWKKEQQDKQFASLADEMLTEGLVASSQTDDS